MAVHEALQTATDALADDLAETKADDGYKATSVRLPLGVVVGLKTLAVRQRARVNDVLTEAAENHLAAHGISVKSGEAAHGPPEGQP